MIDKENRLVEDKWYRVHLEDDYCSSWCMPFKVMGKYHFIGRLICHLKGKLIFNLDNEAGSVIIPFENIKWMVPFCNEEKKKEESRI